MLESIFIPELSEYFLSFLDIKDIAKLCIINKKLLTLIHPLTLFITGNFEEYIERHIHLYNLFTYDNNIKNIFISPNFQEYVETKLKNEKVRFIYYNNIKLHNYMCFFNKVKHFEIKNCFDNLGLSLYDLPENIKINYNNWSIDKEKYKMNDKVPENLRDRYKNYFVGYNICCKQLIMDKLTKNNNIQVLKLDILSLDDNDNFLLFKNNKNLRLIDINKLHCITYFYELEIFCQIIYQTLKENIFISITIDNKEYNDIISLFDSYFNYNILSTNELWINDPDWEGMRWWREFDNQPQILANDINIHIINLK